MLVVDRDHKFMWCEVSTNGENSDPFTFNSCIPAKEPILSKDKAIPYFFLADDDFALKIWLMKPYSHQNMNIPECVFNHRMS